MKKATLAIAVSVMLLGFAAPVNAQCGVRIGEWAYGPSYAADGHVTVSTSTAGGLFVAYASVVDNTSGDPVYIPSEPVGD